MDFNDPCLPDEATVRQFIQIISEHAIRAINGNGSTGVLQLFRINPFDEKVAVPCRFQLDDVDHMVQTALTDAAAGHNVYIEARTVRNDLKGNKRGELEDTVWVLGLVVDSDADKGKGGNVTAKPSLAVETSPGNYHLWYLLDRAIPAMQAKTIGEALRKNVGSRPVDRSRSPIGAAYTLSTAENHRIGRLRRPARFRVRKPQGSLDRAVERSSAARVQGPEPGHPSLCGLFAFAETAGAFSAQRRSGGVWPPALAHWRPRKSGWQRSAKPLKHAAYCIAGLPASCQCGLTKPDSQGRCFVENDISFSVLSDLTDQNLKEIGVSFGHRLQLL